jgi:hypothetical protein
VSARLKTETFHLRVDAARAEQTQAAQRADQAQRQTQKGVASGSAANIDDFAFAPNAEYEVGSQKQVARIRTTDSGQRLISLEAIQLNPAQREAAKSLLGQKMPGALQSAWESTTNEREQKEFAEINRLWNEGTLMSQQQARELARAAFDRHKRRFWTIVRGNPALRATFKGAGMRFAGGGGTAPIYDLPDGTVVRMTLEHSFRIVDDPRRASSGYNLQFVLDDENSVHLEFIRANDPFQP